jgi:hypothetical protein
MSSLLAQASKKLVDGEWKALTIYTTDKGLQLNAQNAATMGWKVAIAPNVSTGMRQLLGLPEPERDDLV